MQIGGYVLLYGILVMTVGGMTSRPDSRVLMHTGLASKSEHERQAGYESVGQDPDEKMRKLNAGFRWRNLLGLYRVGYEISMLSTLVHRC